MYEFKKQITHTLLYVAGVCVILIVSGCAGTHIEQLTAQEFVAHAKHIESRSSFDWTSYIGASPQRAYLEYAHPALIGSGTRTTVFWVPLDELPHDLAEQLRAGNPPWVPWESKTNMYDRTYL